MPQPPARYIAFLRAINVGGHNVKMEVLRQHFADLGLANVETFIASGNVIFDSNHTDDLTLEKRIETHLQQVLGYEVKTFVRSTKEVKAIASTQPFGTTPEEEGNTLYIAFLTSPPSPQLIERLQTYRNEINDFHIQNRELFWLCRRKFSESTFSGAQLEKTLAMPATLRNSTTVKKLAAKYASL